MSLPDARETARSIRPDADDLSRRRSLGIAAVSLVTVIWGLVPLVLKQVDMPALAFAMWRLWMGVAVYAVVLLVTRRRLTWATFKVCALGGVFFGADVALTFSAFQQTSVANATIIGALAPVFILLAAGRLFGERVRRTDLVFVGLSLMGVAMVAIGSSGSPSWSPAGDVFAALSVVSWTAYFLFSKRAREQTSAIEYMASVMTVAAVVVTAAALVSGVDLRPPRGSDWVWIWVVTLLPGFTGHTLLVWSHRFVPAWLSALITQCQPVIGSVAAWIVLGESLTVLTIAGGVVVLAATGTLVLRGARREGEEAGPSAADVEPLIPPASG